MKKLMAFGMAMLMLSPVAQANMVDAKNPKQIANLIKQWASDVQLTTDATGDPMISFTADEIEQTVYFYGCTNGKNCTDISLSAVWSNDEGDYTHEDMNRWNAEKRYARAYLDDDNDINLQMEIDLEHKVSSDYVQAVFLTWRDLVTTFDLGW